MRNGRMRNGKPRMAREFICLARSRSSRPRRCTSCRLTSPFPRAWGGDLWGSTVLDDVLDRQRQASSRLGSIFYLPFDGIRRPVDSAPLLRGSLRSSTAPLPSGLVPQLLSASFLRQPISFIFGVQHQLKAYSAFSANPPWSVGCSQDCPVNSS